MEDLIEHIKRSLYDMCPGGWCFDDLQSVVTEAMDGLEGQWNRTDELVQEIKDRHQEEEEEKEKDQPEKIERPADTVLQ
jgi:hypothetical protein